MKDTVEQLLIYVWYIAIGAVALMVGSTCVYYLLDLINRSFPK